MAIHDLIDIAELDALVPDGFGINDDGNASLAGVEATGRVGPDLEAESARGNGIFKGEPDFEGTLGVAAAPRVAVRAIIRANEKMLLEGGHPG